MAVGAGQALLAFLTGVKEGGDKIDAEKATRMKELMDSNPDESLKSKYTDEYKKFETDKQLIQSIESAGGIGTLKGMQIAGGYDSFAEFKEALDLDPTLINSIKMPVIGKEPIYTPSTYGVTNVREDGKTRTTVSKAFNQLFRPEVFDANQTYEDSQTANKGTATTYRRDKGADITSAQEKNIRASLQKLRNKNKPQTLTKQIQSEDGGWEQVTFTRNENGKTGPQAEELGGKFSLYAGYNVTNTQPWQDPTKQKDGTTLDYTIMFSVDERGNFIPDNQISDISKQVPVNVKAIKTGNPEDKIAIQGGMLEGYKYLQRSIIEDTDDSSGTADMQNLDAQVVDLLADYEVPGRKEKYDAFYKRLGYTEMNDVTAKGIIKNIASITQNANTGNMINVMDEIFKNVPSVSKSEIFDTIQPAEVANYTLDYLPSQDYYNNLEEPLAYEVFINSQSQYFANKHKIPVATAVSVIEKIAKTGITNEAGVFENLLNKINIGNVLTFDADRKVLGTDTIPDLIAKMEKFKAEDPELVNEPWEKIADYVVGQITKAR